LILYAASDAGQISLRKQAGQYQAAQNDRKRQKQHAGAMLPVA
jgi:hypothetical protein